MAINAMLANFTVQPLKNPCPPAGGKFTVTASVTTVAGGNGGTYDVSVWADQGFWPDTELDSSKGNGVGAGRKVTVHIFTLHCDAKCEISGPNKNSGNNPCDIYVYAVDVAGNAKSQSGTKRIACVKEEEKRETEDKKLGARKPAKARRKD